jgi:endonuclease/exonuclease/phosphatase family metal-dependent hydrolase
MLPALPGGLPKRSDEVWVACSFNCGDQKANRMDSQVIIQYILSCDPWLLALQEVPNQDVLPKITSWMALYKRCWKYRLYKRRTKNSEYYGFAWDSQRNIEFLEEKDILNGDVQLGVFRCLDQQVLICNLHLFQDAIKQGNQVKDLTKALYDVQQETKITNVVVLGDFNAKPDDDTDTFKTLKGFGLLPAFSKPTLSGTTPTMTRRKTIDNIFCSSSVRILEAGVISPEDDHNLEDIREEMNHFPIWARLSFNRLSCQ